MVRRYVSFDWAIKKILRERANFDVVEGFLTVLMGRKIYIKNLIDSESNKNYPYDKLCRYDLLAQDENGELYIFEIQNFTLEDYWHRMLFGVSQLVTETIMRGEKYMKVRKIYSINIVYFDLGDGDDYAYRGSVVFEGIGKGGVMTKARRLVPESYTSAQDINDIFPEYIILKVKNFNDVARTPLEEWIQFLKNETIAENTGAAGLREAKEKLDYLKMPLEEKEAYEIHAKNASEERSRYFSAMDEGIAKGVVKVAQNLIAKGMTVEEIAEVTGLSVWEVERLKKGDGNEKKNEG